VDFLLVLNFFPLGVTAEVLRAKIDKNIGLFALTKFQVEGVASHQPFFFLEN